MDNLIQLIKDQREKFEKNVKYDEAELGCGWSQDDLKEHIKTDKIALLEGLVERYDETCCECCICTDELCPIYDEFKSPHCKEVECNCHQIGNKIIADLEELIKFIKEEKI